MEELYLEHHGILGQKWGLRRFQNPDGSYTNAGMKRYSARENYKNVMRDKHEEQSYNKKGLKNNLINEGIETTANFAGRSAVKVGGAMLAKKAAPFVAVFSPIAGLAMHELSVPVAAISVTKDLVDTISMNKALKEIYDEYEYDEVYNMRHSELEHSGILGMKWGVRRFQNSDGTLTEAGKKRYGSTKPTEQQLLEDSLYYDKLNMRKMGEAATKAGKDGKASPSEKITGQSRNIVGEMKDIARTTAPPKRTSAKAKSMSDQELRDAINRMRLERDFDSLNSEHVESGYDKTMKFLNVAGSVIGIGAGIAGIATAYASIKSGGLKLEDIEPLKK